MQITKEQILKVLKEEIGIEQRGYMNGIADLVGLEDAAEQILTLLQSNDAGRPNGAKPHVKCSSCHAPNSIRNNKVEIDIGDEQGSVASVQFEYCEKCGWHGDVEWFD